MQRNTQHIISFVLSLLILYSTVRGAVYHLYYTIDQKGFIENFCINKDKKNLHCEGKCKLKELSKEDPNTAKESNFDFTKFQKEFYWESPLPLLTTTQDFEQVKHLFYYKIPFWDNLSPDFLSPPA